MQEYYPIVTNYGKQKEIDCLAGKSDFDIEEIAIGDGNGSLYEPDADQTALKNEVWRGKIDKIDTETNADGSKTLFAVVHIPADDGGFTIREAGVYDKSGNLVILAKMPETIKRLPETGDIKQLSIRIDLSVLNEVTLPFLIDPSINTATVEYCDSHYQNLNQKGEASGYAPLDENSLVPLEYLPEAVKKQSSGLSMFQIVQEDHVLSFEESKGKALLGSYVYKNGVAGSRYGYPDFYARCVEEKAAGLESDVTLGENTVTMHLNGNGHTFFNISDKAAVDTFYESTGAAWFYGIDTANERVFLPRNDWFFQSGSVEDVGKFVEAGLPKHNHSVTVNIPGSNADLGDPGSYYMTNGGDYNGTRTLSGSASSISNFNESDTVQPNAVKMLCYMVVGNTEATESATEVTEITSSENDTLPMFYNFYSPEDMTTTGAYVDASLGGYLSGNLYKSAYNELVNKIGKPFCAGEVKEPGDETITDYDCVVNQDDMTFRLPLLNGSEDLISDKHTNLAIKDSNSNYVAPANGWFTARMTANANDAWVYLANTNNGVNAECISAVKTQPKINIQARKGDIVTLSYNNITVSSNDYFRFIYAQGNGSLYFKLGNVLQNQDIIDIAGVTSALNTKVDLAQATRASMPSNTQIALTLGSSGTSYTAPADGWLETYLAGGTGSNYPYVTCKVNNISTYWSQVTSEHVDSMLIPMKAGDTFVISYGNSVKTLNLRYHYAEGAI